jgi:hypothetical protein
LNGFLAGMTETKKELSSWLQSLPVFWPRTSQTQVRNIVASASLLGWIILWEALQITCFKIGQGRRRCTGSLWPNATANLEPAVRVWSSSGTISEDTFRKSILWACFFPNLFIQLSLRLSRFSYHNSGAAFSWLSRRQEYQFLFWIFESILSKPHPHAAVNSLEVQSHGKTSVSLSTCFVSCQRI